MSNMPEATRQRIKRTLARKSAVRPRWLRVRVGPELMRFESENHWTIYARAWFMAADVPEYERVCIDSAGRICTCGSDFMRAERDKTYPIVVYLTNPEGNQ